MRPRPLCAVFCVLASFAGAAPVINEVQSSNTLLPDQYGQLIDWVEIHNPTSGPINLQGYYLSDSASDRLKFRFGDATLAAGSFLIVWCGQSADFPVTGPYPSGQVRVPNFNLSSGGEVIILSGPDGATTIDEYPALAIGAGRSMGRGTGGNFDTLFLYEFPTFGAENITSGAPALAADPPLFSLPAGIYTNANLNVAISLPQSVSDGVIRYTLDGSEPTTNSLVYTAPLVLNSSTTTNTNSYIPTNFSSTGGPYYEGWQRPATQPFRINVLRARVFNHDGPGRVQTASYLQHTNGVQRYTVPLVSIATDPANLFSNDRGIYVPGWYNNMFQEGSAWERQGSIEYFETNGSLAFAGAIGLRIHGNTTRSRPRKSLRIYARNPYGASTFEHRIFPQKDISRFDTFLLRNGGNDWGNSLFRDALVTTLAAPSGIDVQSSRPAVVFISGEYWGIHNLRDRIDEGFFLHHYGLGATNFSQIEVVVSGSNSVVVPDSGSTNGAADFQQLLDRAASTGFAADNDYAYLASQIDIDNYIDYNSFEIWSGNTDWPGNNYRLWRSLTADISPGANPRHDGRWRWLLFDTDFALGANFFYVPGHNTNVTTMAQFDSLAHATATNGAFFSNKELGTRLLRKALENTNFRNKFINRFADLLNSSLSVAHATGKLDAFAALYSPEITEHVSRWRQPYNWSNDVSRIRGYMQARPAAVRGHISAKFGLPAAVDLTVSVSETNRGSVMVNTLQIDSSTAGIPANPYPWTGAYFPTIPLMVTALPKPGYRFVSWSNGAVAGGAANYALYSTNPTVNPTLTGNTTLLATFAAEQATSLVIVSPATGAAGTPLAAIQVRAVNSIGDADGNYQGLVILTVTGAGGFSQTLQANAVNGVAEFTGLNLPTAGAYTLNATSGSLGAAPSASFTAGDSAIFLPLTNAVWHMGTNWNTGTVPDGNRAVVTIPANPAADRDVTNNAPTTVASIRFENGSSAFRNRINGIAGQPLALASTGGVSTITVTGIGAGYGNIEVAGGVVLSNDLVVDVQNIAAGNAEYGAFRLQGTVSGPGRIIKRGAGLAGITGSGKTFSGDIVVEQGVLTFSEPAVTGNNATNYTVKSGGQLRLSSSGNPRNYRFKGPLNVAGSGRSGVPESENLGVLGALRLETGTTGNTAVLTNLVNLADSADIHVPAGNAIQFDGPLTAAANTNVLTKSGGGSLTLSAGTETFIGRLSVNRGTLVLGNAQLTNATGTLLVTNDAVLAGAGRWGGGLHLLGGASIAANLGAAPGAAPLRAGSANVLGSAIVNVTMASNAVAGSYPLLAADGGITGAANLQLTVTPSNFPYATLALSNNTLHVVLANAAPGPSFDEWSGGLPANSDDDANGYTALAEFAFGAAAPGAPFTRPFMSVTNGGLTNFLTLTAVIRTNSPRLNVTGQAASSLAVTNVWSTNGVEVITATNGVPADHEQRTYRTPATNNAVFLRLRLQLAP